ncbi:hypothetical protein ACFP2T_01635 [Plantactinospora solaniradicis]|uniref:DUF3558 domain-containing protein n=1 Tax=Plantactinospora solaniradicis TaxID=1723736 RepID=A0ABW1K2G4_9ACTN
MATPENARRFVTLAAAALMVLVGSACGNGADAGSTGDTASFGGPPTATAPAKASTPARPKTITSACKLLPASVVVKVLGGSSETNLKANEAPVEEKETKRYSCGYEDNDREALSLIVTAYPDRADTVKETIDAIAKSSEARTTRIDGVGADAVSYVTDGARVLALALPYETDLRLAILTGPSIIPQNKLAELGKQLASRL